MKFQLYIVHFAQFYEVQHEKKFQHVPKLSYSTENIKYKMFYNS